jgi:hypothetical protein
MKTDVYADTSTIEILPQYNELVESNSNYTSQRIVFFENEEWYTNGTDPVIPAIGSITFPIYDHDLLIGHVGNKIYFTFHLFKLDGIPQSNWWDTKVSIDSAKFRTTIMPVPHYTVDKTYVTLYSCLDNSWFDQPTKALENAIKIKQQVVKLWKENYNTTIENDGLLYPPGLAWYYSLMQHDNASLKLNHETFSPKVDLAAKCYSNQKADDFLVAEKSDLPKVYEFGVTHNVIEAWNKNASITFTTYGDPVPIEIPAGESLPSSDLLDLVSYTVTKNSTYGLGEVEVPTLVVTYSTEPAILRSGSTLC